MMISIPCDHPDLEDFIKIKQNTDKVTKANISIRVTDDFMQAVANRKPYTLKFIREETGEEISKEIDAHEVFMKMCESNWDWGEPGLLFAFYWLTASTMARVRVRSIYSPSSGTSVAWLRSTPVR